MESAFGIEHGYPFSKSLSGKNFKPITQMTGGQKKKILGSYKKLKGVSRSDKKFQQVHNKAKTDLKDYVGYSGEGIKRSPEEMPFGGTYRTGGKKTGKSTVIGNAPTKSLQGYVQTHEGAHATPKRSAYRLHGQIARNPEKLMREEARADYKAGGHYSQHGQRGSTYASAARSQVKAEKHPNRPAKGSKEMADFFGEPRGTNKQAYEGHKNSVMQQLPHYDLSGKKGDKAVGAYRGLHDSMRNKGVPQPKKKQLRAY